MKNLHVLEALVVFFCCIPGVRHGRNKYLKIRYRLKQVVNAEVLILFIFDLLFGVVAADSHKRHYYATALTRLRV